VEGEVYRKDVFDTKAERQNTGGGRELVMWRRNIVAQKDRVKWSERDS